MSSIISIIPARKGSKGIPNKNIRLLGGHPLISYSIAASKMSKIIHQSVVSTDCPKIADIAMRYGSEVPFLRPASLSEDHSLDREFFSHYIQFCQKNNREIPDLIIHLRPTTPLRVVSEIDKAIEYMIENPKFDSLRSMYVTGKIPYKLFKSTQDMEAVPFISDYLHKDPEYYNFPRQHFETIYCPDGIVDIIRPCVLMDTGKLHGSRIKIWKTNGSVDIDSESDFLLVEKTLETGSFMFLSKYLSKYLAE